VVDGRHATHLSGDVSPQRRSLKVVIAEDNYLVREDTRRLLVDSGAMLVLAAVGNADELCDAVRRMSPDAVITDIRMPPGHHMEGIVAAHAIRAEYPTVGVVVLSQHTDESYAFELLRHGTAGLAYLLKDRLGDVRELVHALREVASGGSVIDPVVVDALVARHTRTTRSALSVLTSRELDVLREMHKARPTPASSRPYTCRRRRSRNTSTRSSPSSSCRTRRYIAALRRCSHSSTTLDTSSAPAVE
jgi:DNA-binding NarL/FixJ family response regulator